MSNCKPICDVCPNLVFSQSIAVTDGNLIINIPSNTFRNGQKVCIVTAQNIPNDALVSSNVFVTIGEGAVQYPLVNKCCEQLSACDLKSRVRYSTIVATTPTGGSFRLIGNIRRCCPTNNLASINGTAPTTTPTTPGA